ncbi:hypothetical protein BC831DRAFT_440911 [Entophlyctis helioformis]|nr:hypothetical protein BC831DRAFT_440911 [Entophlyctis helioformis]
MQPSGSSSSSSPSSLPRHSSAAISSGRAPAATGAVSGPPSTGAAHHGRHGRHASSASDSSSSGHGHGHGIMAAAHGSGYASPSGSIKHVQFADPSLPEPAADGSVYALPQQLPQQLPQHQPPRRSVSARSGLVNAISSSWASLKSASSSASLTSKPAPPPHSADWASQLPPPIPPPPRSLSLSSSLSSSLASSQSSSLATLASQPHQQQQLAPPLARAPRPSPSLPLLPPSDELLLSRLDESVHSGLGSLANASTDSVNDAGAIPSSPHTIPRTQHSSPVTSDAVMFASHLDGSHRPATDAGSTNRIAAFGAPSSLPPSSPAIPIRSSSAALSFDAYAAKPALAISVNVPAAAGASATGHSRELSNDSGYGSPARGPHTASALHYHGAADASHTGVTSPLAAAVPLTYLPPDNHDSVNSAWAHNVV